MPGHLRQGDTVTARKPDRLSRPLKDVPRITERMTMRMAGRFAGFERATIRERTSAGLAIARAEGRVGGRHGKLDAAKRRETAESVIPGRKSGAGMARLHDVGRPTVSRIVAQHRVGNP